MAAIDRSEMENPLIVECKQTAPRGDGSSVGVGLLTAGLVALLGLSCSNRESDPAATDKAGELTGELIIFHAGSLSLPVVELVAEFNRRHPAVKVLPEAAGSRDCARKISELQRPCDLFLSADYAVIPELLVPEHANWALPFATNEMVLVWRPEAPGSPEITADNWPQILLREGTRTGRSEPDADPCGYRTMMLFGLAEREFAQPGLAGRLEERTKPFIRPKEVDLLALLEVAELDYAFIYLSNALQHHLDHLRLPARLNLSDPTLNDYYATVTVQLSGRRPGEKVAKAGEAILYGLTIPNSHRNRAAAVAFVRFLTSPEQGGAILARHGQQLVTAPPPALLGGVPPELLRGGDAR